MSDIAKRIAGLTAEQRAVLEKRLKAGAPSPAAAREPIAIVGMGCRFPGDATSPEAFWEMLKGGKDAVGVVPADRWDVDALYDPDPLAVGKIASRWGGFVQGVDKFDAAFFGISPREAVRMDPQQRVLLEVAGDAFEHAGYTLDRLGGSTTGVFVGVHGHASDYLWLQYAEPDEMDGFTGTGTAHNLLAGRLSYAFDLHGPAVVVDTACSSSLVAVHLAVQSLRSGECDAALAAGVNLILTPHFSIAASRMHMLAPDGRCKAFDQRADGFVRGEGCGALVLKRLKDAVADGDPVLVVIRGSASNQDGHTNGITAPNGLAQRAVVERAQKDAGIAAEDVGYVEAHGTGTALGDPIEIEGLAASVGRPRADGGKCLVGSVKTNIGHLEGAAGVAGLIKAALVVQHGEVPANLHFTGLNPHIDVRGTRFEFPAALQKWSEEGRPRRAGVSSFGWSGTNVHVVLEQAPAPAAPAASEGAGPFLLPLSARSPAALAELARGYREWLIAKTEPRALADLQFTAAVRRSHHDHRLAVVGRNAQDLVAGLDRALVDGPIPVPLEKKPRVVFVFPGQGSQWLGMGRSLLDREPMFREVIERCDAAINAEAGWSLLRELEASPETSRLREIDVVQPILFAIEVALAELWRSWGVLPDAVVGHSMGEVAAAHVAGVLSLEDAARIICRRSRLLRQISGKGAMGVVELSSDEAQAALVGYEERLSVAVSNGPRSTVLSGDPAALEEVMAALTAREVFCRPVKVDVASHSPQVDVLRDTLLEQLGGLVPRKGAVPIYSTVTSGVQAGESFGADYWVQNLRQPVRFFDALRGLLSDGHDVFIEMSPHPILLPAVDDVIAHVGQSAITLPSLRREEDELLVLRSSLCAFYVRGGAVDWRRVVREGHALTTLPRYPWQRERFWLESAGTGLALKPARRLSADKGTDTRGWLYGLEWREASPPTSFPTEKGRFVLFADRKGRADALAASLVADGNEVIRVHAAERGQPTGPGAFDANPAEIATFAPVFDAALASGPRLLGVVHFWNLDAPEDVADAAALQQAQVPGVASVIWIVQDLVRRQLERPPRLFVVTEGSQATRAQALRLAQAPAWGLGRVIAEEHPELWGGLLDLDPTDSAEASAAHVTAEIAATEGEDGVAFVSGKRLLLRLAPFAREGHASVTCQVDASYLVTGGLGGVGLETARWLVGRGARHLVLVGRTVLPPRRDWMTPAAEPFRRQIDGIRGLESLGAQVQAVSLDVADPAAVDSFLEELRLEGRPPIRGVIHSAAVSEDALLPQVDLRQVFKVLRPKLNAGFVLDRAFAGTLDFFILYSSLGSLLGQPGQAVYAAANAYLDALASEARRQGRKALAINWGGWAELGLAQTLGARRTIDELERRGVGSFKSDQGLDALGRLLDADATQAAVVPVDWVRFGEVASRTRVPSLVRDLVRERPAAAAPEASLRTRLETMRAEERGPLLEAHLVQQLAQVLRLDPNKIEPHRPMGTLGLESLTALEFRKRLEVSVGVRLSATVMWNYPTLAALGEHLATRLAGGKPAEIERPQPQSPSPAPDTDSLTDEEALRALMSGGRQPS